MRDEIRKKVLSWTFDFRMHMLSRLCMDCDYFLGYGRRCEKYLWAKNTKEQIEYMKEIWFSFSDEEKPEWIAFENILDYEKRMK